MCVNGALLTIVVMTLSESIAKQGHHHNGDQVARRPHMMCSIYGRRFATPQFGVRGVGDGLIQ